MTFTISKDFTWSASHQLAGLPDGHPCGRLHGHNYVARIMLQANTVDDTGFVLDYGLLDPVRDYIDVNLDHHHLNDALLFQPTAENMARHLATLAAGALGHRAVMPGTFHRAGDRALVLVACSISETPKTWATWTPEGWKP